MRRGRRIVGSSVLALLLGVAAVEVAFRWLLFGGGSAVELGAGLRHAAYFADPTSDDDYWKLFVELERLQAPVPDNAYHPELGWVSADFDRTTLDHYRAGELRGRKPVLLYGDSFARCMTSREDCFEGLLERSDLADRFALLNYAVQGYGLDQIHLLVDRTVDRFAEREPVVVIGLMIDDSLDRTVLAIRGWPKPRFTIRDGELALENTPVPRMEEYLRQSGVSFPSYLWRYLEFGAGVVPLRLRNRLRGEVAIQERKRALSLAILRAIHAGLERRGVEHFFLLFHGEAFVDGTRPPDWRDAVLLEFLRGESASFTSARRAILEDATRTGRPIAEYFDQGGPETRGHLVPEGNRAAFQALRDGIQRRYETP